MKSDSLKILHLTLTKKWFDMIMSGTKKEEYRAIKPYWTTRLDGREFDVIVFSNGYGKNSPKMMVEFKGLSVGKGRHDWGGGDVQVYVIKLGNVLKSATDKTEWRKSA